MILEPNDYNGIEFKTSNEYDYLEIGTCDWDIFSITKPNLKGIIVEPISIYFNNVPNNKNVIKVNCAISDKNGEDFMYYIPPDKIKEQNIRDCFRGMNKLGTYHKEHISDKLEQQVTTQKCNVMKYHFLLKRLNIKYVDFVKIDTEGHDCIIINNILDELDENPNYILPKYLFFQNNTLTEAVTINNTIDRLKQYGYVHIFTKNDNTFMYNCKNHVVKNIENLNITFPKHSKIYNLENMHYFQPVHSYVELGQKSLFQNKLKLNVSDKHDDSNVIWTTQNLNEYNNYYDSNKLLINIIHGGGPECMNKLINAIKKPNLIIKDLEQYKSLRQLNTNPCFFIGKYEELFDYIEQIYEYRTGHFNNLKPRFLMLNNGFKHNHISIQNTYEQLKTEYNLDLYGGDSDLGFTNTTSSPIETNVLSQYKFFIHLKGLGNLCNSAIFACMCGMPIIMSRENYVKQYINFIPEDLIIFYDNWHYYQTTPEQIIPVINKTLQMTDANYKELSKKLYIHGTYFRKYYKDEIEHLNFFVNNLSYN